MKLKYKNRALLILGILFLIFLTSCNNGEYSQEYKNYNEFKRIDNERLTGWFPVQLIKSDAYNIKNVSYFSTKCVFGILDYENDELYDTIFKQEKYIDKTHNKIFQSQIESVKTINPEWFPKDDYWKKIEDGIILVDNCYAYRDSEKKQIYYFHPKEESTNIDGPLYPGIRNTIR